MSIVYYQEFFMIRNFVIRNFVLRDFVRQEFCDQELCTCTPASLGNARYNSMVIPTAQSSGAPEAGYRGLQVHESRLRPNQTLVSYILSPLSELSSKYLKLLLQVYSQSQNYKFVNHPYEKVLMCTEEQGLITGTLTRSWQHNVPNRDNAAIELCLLSRLACPRNKQK